jgi:hypothetical protein
MSVTSLGRCNVSRREFRWVLSAGMLAAACGMARGEEPGSQLAENTATEVARPAAAKSDLESSREAILQMARQGFQRVQDIRDYSCLLVKRERVGGVLHDFEYMQAKVRHERSEGGKVVPFSVYLRFLGPDELKGREVLFVSGRHDNKLVVRKGGLRFAQITTEIDPHSDLALRDNRYPITEFGFENLVKRFLDHVEGAALDDCTIQLTRGAKVDDRPCLCIQVSKNGRSPDADFYLARVYIDEELQIPIHYEAFDWPLRQGDEPRLLEQYTYRNVRLNIGLNEADFRRDNPAYGFRQK